MIIDTEIGRIADPVARFFAFARERHKIYLRRQAGGVGPPGWAGLYTNDPILAKYRFTNVYRELDAVTIWFRENVREPLRADPNVLLAVVLFRWFNRMTTGETLFKQMDLLEQGLTPWEEFLAAEPRPMRTRLGILRRALRKQGPPWVTGSYIINPGIDQAGKDKLDGVLSAFGVFCERPWFQYAKGLLKDRTSLEEVFNWICETPGLGPFMSYEIVTDLRWTDMLKDSADIMTWANPGPGAQRGLRRIFGFEAPDDVRLRVNAESALDMMRGLLMRSRDPEFWPADWPRWEMREVEHSLCEWDKMERTRLGQGRPRGVFRG